MRFDSKVPIVAIVLGVLAILMSIGSFLALSDIVQGKEPDLSLEWMCVWTTLPVAVLAQIVAIAAILGLKRRAQGEA
jgi:protein-S-isoprenylcysteine O-methyltransferase Ste14